MPESPDVVVEVLDLELLCGGLHREVLRNGVEGEADENQELPGGRGSEEGLVVYQGREDLLRSAARHGEASVGARVAGGQRLAEELGLRAINLERRIGSEERLLVTLPREEISDNRVSGRKLSRRWSRDWYSPYSPAGESSERTPHQSPDPPGKFQE